MRPSARAAATILMAIVCVFATSPIWSQSATYDSLIKQAESLAAQGDLQGTLSKALEAISLSPSGFQGYYYAGFALFKQDLLDQAKPYAQNALDRAPSEQKADVKKLVDAIADRRAFIVQVKAGDEAFNQGLNAKAAEAYTNAWTLDQGNSEIGLKAARLWSDRLNEPAKAVLILQYLAGHPSEPTVLQTANEMLSKIQPLLLQYFVQGMSDGKQALASGEVDAAVSAFESAEQSQPNRMEPHMGLARSYALAGRSDDALAEIGLAVKNGARAAEIYIDGNRELFTLMGTDKFTKMIDDAFGPRLSNIVRPIVADMEKSLASLDDNLDALERVTTGVKAEGNLKDDPHDGSISYRQETFAGKRISRCEFQYEWKMQNIYRGPIQQRSQDIDFKRNYVLSSQMRASSELSGDITLDKQDWTLNGEVWIVDYSLGFRYQDLVDAHVWMIFADRRSADLAVGLMKSISTACGPFKPHQQELLH